MQQPYDLCSGATVVLQCLAGGHALISVIARKTETPNREALHSSGISFRQVTSSFLLLSERNVCSQMLDTKIQSKMSDF